MALPHLLLTLALLFPLLPALRHPSLHLPTAYHAPTPLPLTLTLSLHPTIRQAPARRAGALTYEPCTPTRPCASPRACLDPSASFTPCRRSAPACLCLLPSPSLCFHTPDCPHPLERCAEVPILGTPLCVSRAALSQRADLHAIPSAPSSGRSLDVCRGDADCAAGRVCTFFSVAADFRPCNPSADRNCACLPPTPAFCSRNDACPRAEVCALTPFADTPFCVSAAAAAAYRAVVELPDPRNCPVRIRLDPPLRAAAPPARAPPGAKQLLPALTPAARIVGGRFAGRHLRRFMVAIFKRNGAATLCTGTLLSPRWVLTVAHCLVDPATSVVLGANNVFGEGTMFPVTRTFRHPQYSSSPESRQFDIAVLEIAGGALKRSKFMQLNDDPDLPRPKSFVRNIGFGARADDTRIPDDNRFSLRQVDVPVVSHRVCNDAYKEIKEPISQKRQLCAGYEKGKCGPCQGDSGGPLIQYNKKQEPVIMGVVSFGVNCALPGFPTVYTRVSGHLAWLKSTGAVFYTSRGVVGNKSCKSGEFLFSFTDQIKFCRQCPAGQISNGGANPQCTDCSNGLARSEDDGTKCVCQGPGRGLVGGVCKNCPPGQFSPAGSNMCKTCPPGSFAPNAGAAGCKKCPAKFFAPDRGSPECTLCPKGTSSNTDGATRCV